VPPGESIYSFFDPEINVNLELILLYENPNAISKEKAIVYDTKALGFLFVFYLIIFLKLFY
jgi:hypothetical protein